MKITMFTPEGPVIYEDVEFVEIEAAEPVQLEGTERGGVQIFKAED